MKYYRYLSVVILLLLVTACGRRLPDPSTEIEVDNAVAEDLDVTEVAEDIEADDPVEAVEQVISLETLVDDTAAFGDPDDALVAQVLAANPIEGEQLFLERNLPNNAQSCSSCHNVTDVRLVGPGMQGLPQRAAGRTSGESAAEYVYNSIIHPNEYVVEDYPANVMPQNYEDVLTEQQLANLTAYMLTLNADGAIPIQERAEEILSAADDTADTVAQAPTQTPFIIIVTATPEGSEPADDTTDEATEEPVVDEAIEATEEVTAEATEVVVDEVTEEAVAEVEDTAEATDEPARVVTVQVVVTATPLPTEEAPAEVTDVVQAPTLPPTPAISPTPDRAARLASLGIAAYGEDAFQENCAECHSVESAAMGEDGPGLLGIPQRAAQQADAGQSAAGYLYDSLSSMDVHETNYVEELGNAPVYDIVAYMLTLDASAETISETTDEAAPEATPETDETDTDDVTGDTLTPLQEAVQNADPEHGETLFAMIEGGSPCSTCHYVDSDESLVGPGMLGLADVAGERVEGQSAEEYLYNSIVHPNEYIVEGYPEMVMPQNYDDLLSEQDMYDLVAYMLTLTD
jgi:mono/diheme cytochrome c family protein